MVKICQDHAKQYDLLFSTDSNPEKSKTVCLSFGMNKNELASIYLNGDPLPWKTKAKHIGSTLHESLLLDQDISEKRGMFIDVCMNLNQEFKFAKSETQIKMLNLYNCHFTGSSAWDFNSNEVEKFYSSFNRNLKVIYDLPWPTHRWLCEALSGIHMKKMIYSRYIKFLNNIVGKGTKENCRSLLNYCISDVRSQTGGNIRKIFLDTGVRITPGVTAATAISNYTVYKVVEEQEWKLPLLHSLLEVRDDQWEIRFGDDDVEQLQDDDINDMIHDICVN